MTDDLIDRLSADLKPVRRSTLTVWLAAGPVDTLLLGAGGFWAASELSRPGRTGRRGLMVVLAVLALYGLLAAIQLLTAPEGMARALVFGGTWRACPLYIAALSVPVFVLVIMAMRRLAPTNLTLAGLAAGLLSGGTGAWIYAFHCGEFGLPFLAIWYTLGIAIVGAAGALTGRWLLRW
jgi:hypothetical protein